MILGTHQSIQSRWFGFESDPTRIVRLDELVRPAYLIYVRRQLFRSDEVPRYEETPVARDISERIDVQFFHGWVDCECHFDLIVQMDRNINVTQRAVKVVAFQFVQSCLAVQENATGRTQEAPGEVKDSDLCRMNKEIDRIRWFDIILLRKPKRVHAEEFPLLNLGEHFTQLLHGARV